MHFSLEEEGNKDTPNEDKINLEKTPTKRSSSATDCRREAVPHEPELTMAYSYNSSVSWDKKNEAVRKMTEAFKKSQEKASGDNNSVPAKLNF
ncbi:MAG: hypothetical protein K2X50_08080 [Gammaproteobacteria bacterium]|nr:hypothetical protein [Gammaproteobacteria bacterium]